MHNNHYIFRVVIAVFCLFGFVCQSKAQYKVLKGRINSEFKPKRPALIYASPKKEGFGSGLSKPVIDSTAIKHWVTFEENKVAISNDGQYFMYNILNQPYRGNTLVVKAIEGNWKKELVGVGDGMFTSDSKQFAYMQNNTLYFLILGTDKRQVIPNVSNFKLINQGEQQWLFYQLNTPDRKLIVRNVSIGKEQQYQNVAEYQFDERSSLLLLKTETEQNGVNVTTLQWINFLDGALTNIWTSRVGVQLISYTADWSNQQLTMLLSDTSNFFSSPKYSIWYYKQGMNEAIMAVNDQTKGVDNDVTLATVSNPAFTKDGKYICFWLKEALPSEKVNLAGPLVDVWSYKDKTVQSMQLHKIAKGEEKVYQGVISVKKVNNQLGKKVIRLMQEEDDEPAVNSADAVGGDYFLVRQRQGGDRFWERKYIYKLLSMNDGSSKKLYESKDKVPFWYSPNSAYLVEFNSDNQYYSYNLKTGIRKKISSKVPTKLDLNSCYNKGYNLTIPIGLAGFVGQGDYVLVYDEYDIWQLDLKGKEEPLNVTKGYGRLHEVRIRIVGKQSEFKHNDTLLLTSFNPINKYNGLYQLCLHTLRVISEPITEPCSLFYRGDANHAATHMFSELMPPVKAKYANMWIVKKESASESPNYFVTTDFKSYSELTNLQPQNDYNWLTAEVWNWIQTDNSIGRGVLYKPQNFDSSKEYPVIISYYERMSGAAHQFPKPQFLNSTFINVPWFVSRGYLVLRLDIEYTKAKMVESVCNSVISAAKCFSLLPYVNAKKIGIASFSWGGHQTNWLVTNSKVFAAAATGGGMSDPISSALQIFDVRGKPENEMLESREGLIGTSMWESPSTWIAASTVLNADKVHTPMLIMYNYGDKGWQQGVELYNALRRLDKKVWFLQYDRGSHGLYDQSDAEDFTIRFTQFFDHYLKDAPPPKWMTQGIPAKLKGVEMRYELNDSTND